MGLKNLFSYMPKNTAEILVLIYSLKHILIRRTAEMVVLMSLSDLDTEANQTLWASVLAKGDLV